MKKIIAIIACAFTILLLASCSGNKKSIIKPPDYDEAIISMLDGTTKTVEIDTWSFFSDSNKLIIKSKDGNFYFTAAMNCVLIKKG